MGLFMAPTVDAISLPFSESLIDWADRFSQLSGFAYLDNGAYSDSAEFELLTALPTETFRLQDYSGELGEWMTAIEAALDDPDTPASETPDTPLTSGRLVIGSLDYDASAAHLQGTKTPQPNSTAGLYHWALITNLKQSQTRVLFHEQCPESTRERVQAILHAAQVPDKPRFELAAPFSSSISKDMYRQAIATIHDYILSGDCYQVNFAQRFAARIEGDAWAAYRIVRERLAGGFSGFLRISTDHAILSLSPERFLTVRNGVVSTQPIKGTAPRHADPIQDAALARALSASPKDRAENVMITDLLRNDLGQFCLPGSVLVTELCGLHSFSNVHHLISTVEGTLRAGISPGQLLLATSPGGSITGAPKRRAVEIITELESHPRGAYCGSIFVMVGSRFLQSSIAIRTLESKAGTLVCWGGGGITASSLWESEYQETLDKVGPIMSLLEQASQCSGSSIPS